MTDTESLAKAPQLSIVVPVLDGAATLGQCLKAIERSTFRDWELIVVDDGSADASAEIAAGFGALVLLTAGREGPGAARNLGARHARGEILLFIDADCSVAPHTLALAIEILRREPNLDALFGSYDADPSAPGIVARYKNLQHHYVHQSGDSEASTFWAGCGAIRKSVFESLGGFDSRRYPRPCIEDIELGYRLTSAGGRVRLAREVQVTHHKGWTLTGVLRSDLLDRGIPWTLLLLERHRIENGLNVGLRGRLGVGLILLLLLGLAVAPVWLPALWLSASVAVGLVAVNWGFYRLLARQGGLSLLAGGMLLHWLYLINCAVAYGVGHLLHWRRRRHVET